MIKRFRHKCVESGRGEGVLSSSLRDAFAELEEYVFPGSSMAYASLTSYARIVLESIVTLQKCKVESARKRDRFRLYLKRSELAKSIQDCSSKMAKAVQGFNVRVNKGHN